MRDRPGKSSKPPEFSDHIEPERKGNSSENFRRVCFQTKIWSQCLSERLPDVWNLRQVDIANLVQRSEKRKLKKELLIDIFSSVYFALSINRSSQLKISGLFPACLSSLAISAAHSKPL